MKIEILDWRLEISRIEKKNLWCHHSYPVHVYPVPSCDPLLLSALPLALSMVPSTVALEHQGALLLRLRHAVHVLRLCPDRLQIEHKRDMCSTCSLLRSRVTPTFLLLVHHLSEND